MLKCAGSARLGTRVRQATGLIAVVLAAVVVGCGPSRQATLARLRADNPRDQVAAIAQVVRARDKTMAGELINLLESEDEGVRFMAASALHQLTGKDFGFHFATKPQERAAAVQKWRQWWQSDGHAAGGGPPTQDANRAPGPGNRKG